MKLGFLFGAGAEITYGLPSGGKFALDIFRQDSTDSKNQFKEVRNSIDPMSNYVYQWLPEDYTTRSISSYGKNVFENIIKDTIEHSRDNIIKKINAFDEIADTERQRLIKTRNYDISEIIEKLIGKNLDNCHMNSVISFNEAFKEGNEIFKSKYFSALLEIYKKSKEFNATQKAELGKIIVSLLQLQIGALSENLTRNINDNLFSKKDDDIDIFDDLGEIIRINYQATGMSGMEYLLEKKTTIDTNDVGKVLYFAQSLIENIYSTVLDYKSLIDSNWHYLYCPKEEWAKFSKICIFLYVVRNYIISQIEGIDINDKEGYYGDLAKAIGNKSVDVSYIATTNYNDIIEKVTKQSVIYLNGSVNQWYDPYLNKIGTKDVLNQKECHFLVPLMFTQSGTKPMTSIHKTIEYVELYNSWKESDAVVVVGFGFNQDDEHINGILRTLVDEDNKDIFVISVTDDSENTIKKQIKTKLKVNNLDRVKIVKIDKITRTNNGDLWIDAICKN